MSYPSPQVPDGLACRMDTASITHALESALEGRRLLSHPFYRRWEAGQLTSAELAAYAEQYRHVEAALPTVLEAVASSLPDGPARRLTEANLAEERGTPVAHAELFETFADAVGASPARPAEPATAALVECQRRAAARGAISGLATLAAYELQAPEIASTKAAALRVHFGLDGVGTRFWDVHATMEADHARWLVEALGAVGGDAGAVEEVAGAASESARAWWSFLDEREAAASAPTASI